MKRRSGINWKMVIMTPITVSVMVFGMWVAITAAREDYLLMNMTKQILTMLAVARDSAPSLVGKDERASSILRERLVQLDPSIKGKTGDFLQNPWGYPVRVEMRPSYKRLQVETFVSPPVCRRLLIFYAKEAVQIGLRRVDIRNIEPSPSEWRLVYDMPEGEKEPRRLKNAEINAGCGNADMVALALVFLLP